MSTKSGEVQLHMINPVNHASSPEATATYWVKPYVMAADVYPLGPHNGRGGSTWYSVSADWMYRLILESLLGLRLEVDKLRLAPRLPAVWQALKIHYRYRETDYHIAVSQPRAGDAEMSGITAQAVSRTIAAEFRTA